MKFLSQRGAFGIPHYASLALALVSTAVAALSQTVVESSPWSSYLLVASTFFAGVGIAPLSKDAVRALLPPHVAGMISAALSAAAVGVTTLSISDGLKAAICGILAFAAGLGFGPGAPVVPPVVGPVGPTPTGGRRS